MTTTQKLAAAKEAADAVLAHHRAAYCNVQAIRALYAEQKTNFLFNLGQHPAAMPLNVPNSAAHMHNHISTDRFTVFSNLKCALELAEASPGVIEAEAILQPLVDRVAELEAQLIRESEEHQEKVNALREAEEAATAKAQALLAKDPTIAKLRAEIAASAPTHVQELHPMPSLVTAPVVTEVEMLVRAE